MGMMKINIKATGVSVDAELLPTPTADAIYNTLPITGSANVWGEEIYFDIPLQLEQEDDAREEVARERRRRGSHIRFQRIRRCATRQPAPLRVGNRRLADRSTAATA